MELTTEGGIAVLVNYLNSNSQYAVLDVETTGLDPFKDTITDIVITGSDDTDQVHIFPGKYAHLLSNLLIPVVCHNFKFDFHMLYRAGVDLRNCGLKADTMLLDHLLDENQEHGLDAIIKRRYNDDYKEKFWSEFKEYKDAPKERQQEYACKDVYYTARLYRDLTGDLQIEAVPQSLIDHAHSLALTLYDTEISGIKLDLDWILAESENLGVKILDLKKRMRELVDDECYSIELAEYQKELDKRKTDKGKLGVKMPEFNFDSTKQLQELLYRKLRLPVQVNKKRKPTADDAALEALEDKHEFVRLLREYRGHQKVKTAFIDGSLEKMRDGRIYPSFNVNGTVTGRISSSNPNLQQLPKDGNVRGIYIPDEGRAFITCDFSQLEVVIAAHFSQDPNLLKIVNEGVSKHDITNEALGLKDRQLAKTINFAMQYLCGWQKIKKLLGCSDDDAKHLWNKYWETYKEERKVVDRCIATVNRGEPIISPWGRRRHFPSMQGLDIWARERCYRQAYNALIQGTGADCTSWSVYTANYRLKRAGVGKVLFSVHDELISSTLLDKAEKARDIISSTMIESGKVINLSLNLSVDCSKPMSRWTKG